MKIATIVGARPQFVKAAEVSREFKQLQDMEEIIIHTGQHYDANMSDVFFEELNIPKPDYNLGIGGGSHGARTGQQLENIENVLLKEEPDCVLVYGDTNSTLAGALAAAKLHIPVVHVEAGLRSFNMRMPEEINRILTDQVSTLLFCPTQTAIQNLTEEGFDRKDCKMINVGDVMYDSALYYASKLKKPKSINKEVESDHILATIHRAENTDSPEKLANIIDALNELNSQKPVICPIHPRTRKIIETLKLKPKFILLDPVSYFEMLWLLKHSSLVVTDSGGLQKEAYFFKKFCVTVRDQTEWVELIKEKVNILVGADKEEIIKAAISFLSKEFKTTSLLYGNGDAGMKIAGLIKSL